jgi:transcriptional regulator of acetoin/glycerol metabolism
VPDDLPESLLATSPAPQNLPNYHEAVNEMKKKFLLQAIEQANGNYTVAAKLLGIHSTNLHRLIRTLGLRTGL